MSLLEHGQTPLTGMDVQQKEAAIRRARLFLKFLESGEGRPHIGFSIGNPIDDQTIDHDLFLVETGIVLPKLEVPTNPRIDEIIERTDPNEHGRFIVRQAVIVNRMPSPLVSTMPDDAMFVNYLAGH